MKPFLILLVFLHILTGSYESFCQQDFQRIDFPVNGTYKEAPPLKNIQKLLPQLKEIKSAISIADTAHLIETDLAKAGKYVNYNNIDYYIYGKITNDKSTVYLVMMSASGIENDYQLLWYEWENGKPHTAAYGIMIFESYVLSYYLDNYIFHFNLGNTSEQSITITKSGEPDKNIFYREFRNGEWH